MIDLHGLCVATNAVVATFALLLPNAAVVVVAPPLRDATPEALSVVNAPVLAVALPIGPGAANVAPPSVAALMALLHPMPVLLV